MSVRYRPRPAAQAQLLRAPGGPVDTFVQTVGRRTRGEAILLSRARLNRRTGAYDSAFETEATAHPLGPACTIRNTDSKSLLLELGSAPHVIRPIAPGGYKVAPFVPGSPRHPAPPRGWLLLGGRHFARQVNHPGTRPYRILTDALRRVIASL